jgi:hypothetical protein
VRSEPAAPNAWVAVARPDLLRLVNQDEAYAPPLPEADVVVTERWEGWVTHVDEEAGLFEGMFHAAGQEGPLLKADFLLEQVDEDDRELVRLGGLFYAVAGKLRVSRRQWLPTSLIRFRRLPRVGTEDVEDAFEYGEKMRQRLGLE